MVLWLLKLEVYCASLFELGIFVESIVVTRVSRFTSDKRLKGASRFVCTNICFVMGISGGLKIYLVGLWVNWKLSLSGFMQ